MNKAATPEPAPKRGGRSITILVVAEVVHLMQLGSPMHSMTCKHVIADLVARDAMGFEKYGQNLETGDGRDTINDLYQEILDGAQYARKLFEETGNESARDWFEHLVLMAIEIRSRK